MGAIVPIPRRDGVNGLRGLRRRTARSDPKVHDGVIKAPGEKQRVVEKRNRRKLVSKNGRHLFSTIPRSEM